MYRSPRSCTGLLLVVVTSRRDFNSFSVDLAGEIVCVVCWFYGKTPTNCRESSAWVTCKHTSTGLGNGRTFWTLLAINNKARALAGGAATWRVTQDLTYDWRRTGERRANMLWYPRFPSNCCGSRRYCCISLDETSWPACPPTSVHLPAARKCCLMLNVRIGGWSKPPIPYQLMHAVERSSHAAES